MVKTAETVRELLKAKGYNASLINARFVKPIDETAVLEACENHKLIVSLEENVRSGGFGEKVLNCLNDNHKSNAYLNISIPDAYVEHGNVELLKKEIGLDAESIADAIICQLNQ
jgi:1-deoxy-D-xylulose-5-phosphate synthase